MKKKHFNYLQKTIILLLIISVTIGCNKEEIGPQGIDNQIFISTTSNELDFLVINEGSFNFGNSSLSYYNGLEDEMNNHVFESINELPLGDTFQSISKINNNYYLVINNSGKVIVTDSTFKVIDEIENFNSPRHFQQINDSIAYVSDLYANEITIVNLNHNTISQTFPFEGWSEKIFLLDGKVYIQNNTENSLVQIDPTTHLTLGEIELAAGISGIVTDNDNNIWVLCNGGYLNEADPVLYHLSSETNSILQTFEFDTEETIPNYLTYNSIENCIYFSQDGIKKMSCNATSLPDTTFLANQFSNIYSVNFNNNRQELVITDANDFVSQGDLYRYNQSGGFIANYTVGINPNGIFVLD